ncbi:MAG: addiction module protein [Kosmotoga sp.]|nr:MAG: addiction module protein [Kosmotoga sp.]
MTQKNINLEEFSKDKKIRLMEAIWEDLSKNEENLSSPNWHKKALSGTENRLKNNEESVKDWHTAKKELLNRFE